MSYWQKRDLALCVKGGPIPCPHYPGVHRGDHFKGGEVRSVGAIFPNVWESGFRCGCVSLQFSDGTSGLCARFVKVTPPKADEFDREVIKQMLGGKVEA